jgi:integrase/recombinase XerD
MREDCSLEKLFSRMPEGLLLKSIPIYLTRKEIYILLRLPDGRTVASARDKVLLNVLYATGARAQGLCDLTVGDIRFNEKTSVKLVGVGNKGRVVTIPDNCTKLLLKHLKDYRIIQQPKRYVFSSQTQV